MMDYDPLECFLLTITALAIIIGQYCVDLVTEEMSSDHARKHSATSHLGDLFPNQRGLMKNSEHCKRQITSLKCVLRDINQWHSTSGVHWDNVNGVKLETEEEKQVFRTWLQDRPRNFMHQFENTGWSHLEAMEELFLNDQAHGSCAYHPTSHTNFTSCSISSVSAVPCPSTVHDTFIPPPGYVGSSSSNTSSNLIMTPPAPSQFMPPWVRSPTGTIANGVTNDVTIKKHADYTNTQPQSFSPFQSPQSLILPLASPAVVTGPPPRPTSGSISSSEAALQSISLGDDGEWSLKRVKKGKEHSTQAALVSIQGSMSFLGSVIMSSSSVATQRLHTKKLQAALLMVEECDQDLPIEVKSALLEAFHIDAGAIDLYMMLPNKVLYRNWIQTCIHHLQLVPKNFTL
ncbi:hypothetical protein EDD16DRAFT_1709677 [Pisolithus croceorrhizus]|nr:hypothetical protein EDD16DRAFT_1709677 [Pisolithus croceorrhizus]